MAQAPLSKVRGRGADLPYQVSVTVTHDPNGRAHRVREGRARLTRASRSLRVALALTALVVVVLAAVVAVGPERGATQHTGAAAVAAAFGYPQRCLSIAISAGEPDYASAHVDRRTGCGNYRGYVNASLHRVDGVWRLILDEGQLFVPNRLLAPATAGLTPAGAASAYPLECLSAEIILHDARFARAGFDRSLACVRDHGWDRSRLSDRARPRVSRPAS